MFECFRTVPAIELKSFFAALSISLFAACSSDDGSHQAVAVAETPSGGAAQAGNTAAAGRSAMSTGGAGANTGGTSSSSGGVSTAGTAGRQSDAGSAGAASGGGHSEPVAPRGGSSAGGAGGSAGETDEEPGVAGAAGSAGDGSEPGVEPEPIVEPEPTVGSGEMTEPAIGPSPAFAYDEGVEDYVLVKNWDFGRDGTIRDIDELSEHFQYHDQFGKFSKYGSHTVAPNADVALNEDQPIENVNTDRPVRSMEASSIKTYVVGLDGAESVNPSTERAGCGSFHAKWKLPNGGALLGKDLLWETRVRYVTPPYFWFAIWASGNKWHDGAEMDLIESFGYDNGNGHTNFNGKSWHSSPVGGTVETNYHKSWSKGMALYGISGYDASQYHTWTWVYKADDTYESYNDGILVQRGVIHWTDRGVAGGEPIDVSFIFDASWGHSDHESVNRTLAVSELEGKFYEWDYSRVYLRDRQD